MKKIIALTLAASAFIIPATASASASGAEHALEREVQHQTRGMGFNAGKAYATCRTVSRRFWKCSYITSGDDYFHGSGVEVRYNGRRYVVDMDSLLF